MTPKWFDMEVAQLEEDFSNGFISLEGYQEGMKELEEELAEYEKEQERDIW